MFVAGGTDAEHHSSVPLAHAWDVCREAYRRGSGLARTMRGPGMSANPREEKVLGVGEVNGERILGLRFIQGRNLDWAHRSSFAEYNNQATQ